MRHVMLPMLLGVKVAHVLAELWVGGIWIGHPQHHHTPGMQNTRLLCPRAEMAQRRVSTGIWHLSGSAQCACKLPGPRIPMPACVMLLHPKPSTCSCSDTKQRRQMLPVAHLPSASPKLMPSASLPPTTQSSNAPVDLDCTCGTSSAVPSLACGMDPACNIPSLVKLLTFAALIELSFVSSTEIVYLELA